MNITLIKLYIEKYKREFENIHNQEIYKWQAIKQFQDNFDIDSKDFYSNIELSLNRADNLLSSSLYFPKAMLLENTKESPEEIRVLFKALFNEDLDILGRVENFRKQFNLLSKIS